MYLAIYCTIRIIPNLTDRKRQSNANSMIYLKNI